jgi:hypothetical protein
MIDRSMLPAGLRSRRQAQDALLDLHVRPGRDHVDTVGLHGHLIRDFGDRHAGRARQDLSEHTGVSGVEVLDQDEGHAGIGRQRLEHLLDGFKPARRSAGADDREGRNGLPRWPFFGHWLGVASIPGPCPGGVAAAWDFFRTIAVLSPSGPQEG